MTIKRNIKKFAKTLLSVKMTNSFVRRALRFGPISSVIPESLKTRMPVVGEITVGLPSGKSLVLHNDGNDTIASRIYWLGLKSYEPETIRVLYKLFPHVKTFLDIGANIGLLSLLAALDDPQRQVHAFEPVPWIAAALKKNALINQVDNLTVQTIALTDFDGEIDMYIPMDVGFPTGSSTVAGYREASQVIKVKALRLDTYLSQQNITEVSLIKIDTETTEPAVLAGSVNTIMAFKPIIICEVQPNKTETALHSIFDNNGYEFYHITDKGLVKRDRIVGDPTGTHLNYIFLPVRHQIGFTDILSS